MKNCPKCKSQISEQAKFCGSCGFKIDSNFLIDINNIESQSPSYLVSSDVILAISQTIFVLPSSLQLNLRKLLEDKNCFPLALISDLEPINLLKRVGQFIRQKSETLTIRYLCIIGDWNDVPPVRVENPFSQDLDEYCFSDSLYACQETFDPENIFSAIPSISVGRIPSTQSEIIAKALFESPPKLDLEKNFLFSVSAECWEEATEKIISECFMNKVQPNLFNEPGNIEKIPKISLLTSPSWSEFDLREQTSGIINDAFGIILFNVHGGADDPQWVGESHDHIYEKIFSPSTIENFNSALIVSEACYGGALGYDEPSIVESFFNSGGHAFVGSSTIAYGSPFSDISGADLIALHFIKSINKGFSLGEALNIAKYELLVDDPLAQDVAKKSILSFNLFGAPWHQREIAREPSFQGSNRSSSESILDRVRNRQTTIENLSNTSLVTSIREKYQAKLPVRLQKALIDRESAWLKFNKFKDFNKISKILIDFGAKPEDIQLDSLTSGNIQGYSIYIPSMSDKEQKKAIILIMDSVGGIQKTLVSKGTK